MKLKVKLLVLIYLGIYFQNVSKNEKERKIGKIFETYFCLKIFTVSNRMSFMQINNLFLVLLKNISDLFTCPTTTTPFEIHPEAQKFFANWLSEITVGEHLCFLAL